MIESQNLQNIQNLMIKWGKLANRQLSGGRPVGQTALVKKGFEGFVGFVRKRT